MFYIIHKLNYDFPDTPSLYTKYFVRFSLSVNI